MMQTLRCVSNAKSERGCSSDQKDTERSFDKKTYISRNVNSKKYQSLRQRKKG